MYTFQVNAQLMGMRRDGAPKPYEYLLQAPDYDTAMAQAEEDLAGLCEEPIEIQPL